MISCVLGIHSCISKEDVAAYWMGFRPDRRGKLEVFRFLEGRVWEEGGHTTCGIGATGDWDDWEDCAD